MDKKTRFRAGLAFGTGMSVFYLIQNLFRNDDWGARHLIVLIGGVLFAGAITGVLFGWIMWRFSNSKKVKEAVKFEPQPGENILFETPANHFKALEAVGGKLYLTNKRLVYKSHHLNIKNHQLSIDLADIIEAKRHKSMGIINNGLTIITNQNKPEKFVVERSEEWIKRLMATKSLL